MPPFLGFATTNDTELVDFEPLNGMSIPHTSPGAISWFVFREKGGFV